MAVNRVLTSAEKEILVGNQDFKNQVSWALRDFASYYNDVSDAAAKVAATSHDRWAKNYSWAARAVANVTISDNPQAPEDFGVLLKGMQLWDSAVNGNVMDVAVVISYMVSTSKFEELATNYVISKTPTMVF